VDTLISWTDALPIWGLGLVLFTLFWLAALLGRTLAARRRAPDKDADPGLLVSASLGLMALLLGFTVSMAVSRYDERRAVMLREANAIGTFLYRTDFLPVAERSKVLDALEPYVDARVRVGAHGMRPPALAEARAVQAQAQAQVWQAVVAASAVATDGSFRMLVVNAANEMFDSATARDVALENRLPPTLMLLLLLFPTASLLLIGYSSGKSVGAHLMASTELILLLTLVLLLIADLNRPRRGTIMAPNQAMEDVQRQLATISRPAGIPQG
jgi:hypothetical protein